MNNGKTSILEEAKKSQFPSVPYDRWLEKVKPLTEDTFIDPTRGLPSKILYTEADLGDWIDEIRGRIPKYNGWRIAQKITGTSTEEIRERLLEALDGGQDTLSFSLCREWSWQDLDQLLSGIELEKLPFFIQSEELTVPFYILLKHWADERQMEGNHFSGLIGTDPLGEILLKGYLPEEAEDYYRYWCEGILYAKQHFPELKTIYINGSIYEQAGGTHFQQLAYILMTCVEHLERLKENGLMKEEFFHRTVVGISVGSDFFGEIAKVRALRYLWSKLVEAYGLNPEQYPISIYAETAKTNKTSATPYNNLLRNGAEALAIAIAQVDWIQVLPYDGTDGRAASPLATRISRNTHHILREESRIEEVTDPSGGSYFVEALTREIIEKAWNLFLEGEEAGGIMALAKKGILQQTLEANRKEIIHAYEKGRKALLGVHLYPEDTEDSRGFPEKKDIALLQKAKIMKLDLLEKQMADSPKLKDFILPIEKKEGAIPALKRDGWEMVFRLKGGDA